MKSVVFFLVLLSALYAADGDDINRLIEEIVNAPAETRYEKMNAFKKKMRELNTLQRAEALKALQMKACPDRDLPAAAAAEHRLQNRGRLDKSGNAAEQMRMRQQQYRMHKSGNGNGGGGGHTSRIPPTRPHQGGR